MSFPQDKSAPWLITQDDLGVYYIIEGMFWVKTDWMMRLYHLGYFLLGFLTIWFQSFWFVPLLIGYDILGLFFTTEKMILRPIRFPDKQRWADTGIPFLAIGITLALVGRYIRGN